jgi:hypothetical protein
MTYRNEDINRMRLSGLTSQQISEKIGLSIPAVDNVLYSQESKDYRKNIIDKRNSRSILPLSDRLAMIAGEVVGALESSLDACHTTADRLRLIDSLTALSRIIPLTDRPADRENGIIIVPDPVQTMPIEGVPSGTGNRIGTDRNGSEGVDPPAWADVSPGRSEISASSQIREIPQDAASIEEDFLDVGEYFEDD